MMMILSYDNNDSDDNNKINNLKITTFSNRSVVHPGGARGK